MNKRNRADRFGRRINLPPISRYITGSYGGYPVHELAHARLTLIQTLDRQMSKLYTFTDKLGLDIDGSRYVMLDTPYQTPGDVTFDSDWNVSKFNFPHGRPMADTDCGNQAGFSYTEYDGDNEQHSSVRPNERGDSSDGREHGQLRKRPHEESTHSSDVKRSREESTRRSDLKRSREESTRRSDVKSPHKESTRRFDVKSQCVESTHCSDVKRPHEELTRRSETSDVKNLHKESTRSSDVKSLHKESTRSSDVKSPCEEPTNNSEVKSPHKESTHGSDVKSLHKESTHSSDIYRPRKELTRRSDVKRPHNESSHSTDVKSLHKESTSHSDERSQVEDSTGHSDVERSFTGMNSDNTHHIPELQKASTATDAEISNKTVSDVKRSLEESLQRLVNKSTMNFKNTYQTGHADNRIREEDRKLMQAGRIIDKDKAEEEPHLGKVTEINQQYQKDREMKSSMGGIPSNMKTAESRQLLVVTEEGCLGGKVSYTDNNNTITPVPCESNELITGETVTPAPCESNELITGETVTPVLCESNGAITGETITPALCESNEPITGETVTPALCESNEPITGETVTPALCESNEPITGETVTPALCESNKPITGETVTPAMCESNKPITGETVTPALCESNELITDETVTPALCESNKPITDETVTPALCESNKPINQIPVNLFLCDFCLETAPKKDEIVKHLRECHHFSASQCTVSCKTGQEWSTVRILQPMFVINEEPLTASNGVVTCFSCEAGFPNPYLCGLHNIQVHNSTTHRYRVRNVFRRKSVKVDSSMRSCPECKKGFITRGSLFEHWKTSHHVPYKRPGKTEKVIFSYEARSFRSFNNFFDMLEHFISHKTAGGLMKDLDNIPVLSFVVAYIARATETTMTMPHFIGKSRHGNKLFTKFENKLVDIMPQIIQDSKIKTCVKKLRQDVKKMIKSMSSKDSCPEISVNITAHNSSQGTSLKMTSCNSYPGTSVKMIACDSSQGTSLNMTTCNLHPGTSVNMTACDSSQGTSLLTTTFKGTNSSTVHKLNINCVGDNCAGDNAGHSSLNERDELEKGEISDDDVAIFSEDNLCDKNKDAEEGEILDNEDVTIHPEANKSSKHVDVQKSSAVSESDSFLRIHQNELSTTCDLCGKNLKKRSQMFRHLNYERHLSASECSTYYIKGQDLVVNGIIKPMSLKVKKLSLESSRFASCCYCGACFSNSFLCAIHTSHMHGELTGEYGISNASWRQEITFSVRDKSCKECKEQFNDMEGLFNHWKETFHEPFHQPRSDETPVFFCKYCRIVNFNDIVLALQHTLSCKRQVTTHKSIKFMTIVYVKKSAHINTILPLHRDLSRQHIYNFKLHLLELYCHTLGINYSNYNETVAKLSDCVESLILYFAL